MKSTGQRSWLLEGKVGLLCKDGLWLGQMDTCDRPGGSRMGSLGAGPQTAQVFKGYKEDTHLDVGKHVGDL